MIDFSPFQGLKLRSGFVLREVKLTAEALIDPIERPATAQTIIRGRAFSIFLRADLDEWELSVSLYHEVLEAATVAVTDPPDLVADLNERGFELAAQEAHRALGVATPERLNQMLANFGF